MRNLFAKPVRLKTAMPKDQVLHRLRESAGGPFSFALRPWFGKPVFGRVGDHSCTLNYRSWYNNGFQRRLSLEIHGDEFGTSLEGQFAPNPAALIFMGFWFFAAFCFCLLITLMLITKPQSIQPLGAFSLIPFGILIFGIALGSFGIWLSKFAESALLAFLTDTIGAMQPTQGEVTVPVSPQWPRAKPVPADTLRPRHEVPEKE